MIINDIRMIKDREMFDEIMGMPSKEKAPLVISNTSLKILNIDRCDSIIDNPGWKNMFRS